MLQKVSVTVGGVDLVGVLHLPEGASRGAALVLHGFGGHPDQPHLVETAQALADAGLAAYRFPYRDHRPPTMTLASALDDAEHAVAMLRAHPQVDASRLAIVGFSFGGAVAALLAGGERAARGAVLAAATSKRDGHLDPVGALAKTKARVLLLWGTRDTEVSTLHAERFAAALAKAKVEHAYETIEGADHDFGPPSRRAEMARRVAEWCAASIAE